MWSDRNPLWFSRVQTSTESGTAVFIMCPSFLCTFTKSKPRFRNKCHTHDFAAAHVHKTGLCRHLDKHFNRHLKLIYRVDLNLIFSSCLIINTESMFQT